MSAEKRSSKPAKRSTKKSSRKKPAINPDDVGISREEADQIILELDDLTQEEVDKQARETDA